MVVTVEATDRASSYQGVVPIAVDSLGRVRSRPISYQSEQLPTRVRLASTPGVECQECWCNAYRRKAARRHW